MSVWQSRISGLITRLSSALSSQPAIPGLPAPWKHPEASALRGEGLRLGSWQTSRQLAVAADGVLALLGQAWFEAQGHSGGHTRRVSHCQEEGTSTDHPALEPASNGCPSAGRGRRWGGLKRCHPPR